MPKHFKDIEDVIESSKYILTLDDEDEGSQGYSEVTWRIAINLINECALSLWYKNRYIMPTPEIFPGPDGSIDIHWKDSKFELLLNLPGPEDDEPPSYYGDNYGSNNIKGTLDITKNNLGILIWFLSR